MTGQELVDALLKLTPEQRRNLEVQTEGCDCYGEVARVQVDVDRINGGFTYIYLYRS